MANFGMTQASPGGNDVIQDFSYSGGDTFGVDDFSFDSFNTLDAAPPMPAQPQTRGDAGGWHLTKKMRSAAHSPFHAPSDPYFGRSVAVEKLEQTGGHHETKIDWSSKSAAEKVLELISLQDFEGSWAVPAETISGIAGLKIPKTPQGGEEKVWVTLMIINFLEQKMAVEEGTWALVVEKARGWLAGLDLTGLPGLEKEAYEFIRKQ
jgi:hypothetical protein